MIKYYEFGLIVFTAGNLFWDFWINPNGIPNI